jgi:hypothetical protein
MWAIIALYSRAMKLEERRQGVFTTTLTAYELSTLLAGARMSLTLMETDPAGSTERARDALQKVLADFDEELARLRKAEGGPA